MRRMIQGDDSSETAVIQERRSGPRYTAFAFPSAAIMSLIGFLSCPVGPIRAAPDAPLQIQHDPQSPALKPSGPPPERRTICPLIAYQPVYAVSTDVSHTVSSSLYCCGVSDRWPGFLSVLLF
ncbi:hypothetical protein QQF64_005115 [Cirrhinus molitorella]|uniref:Uncharacterized protein n=1 Tax=Cirrhinus molitorella TaxID=172907 RepID=A0ABR3MJH3_9TELE